MNVKFRLVAQSAEEAGDFIDMMTGQGAQCELYEEVPYLDIRRLVTVPDSQYMQADAGRGPFLATELDEDSVDEDEILVEHEWPTVWVVECDRLPKGLKI